MKWLALDIGGANLKIADGDGFARSHAFALWREPQKLAHAVRCLLAEPPQADRLAVTMTGELADCFASKAEGVKRIVQAVCQAADGLPLCVYLTDGRLVPPHEAVGRPQEAAASNWHVLARFAARYIASKTGLLIDIGTTTTDIVPIVEGWPRTIGMTDPERLAHDELVYTGVVRSPLAAVVRRLPWRDRACPVAQELFATMHDAYLLLEDLPEEPDNHDTADGKPATREFAINRLARMICADSDSFSSEDAIAAAAAAARCQSEQIRCALQRVIDRPDVTPLTICICGRGEFLARRILNDLMPQAPVVSLGQRLGQRASVCATAHALAVVARELAL